MYESKFKMFRNLCIVVISVITLIAIIISSNKKKNEIINIGFSAQLTGRQAELGVQERNGSQLAIEKANNDGGINGHMLSLIVHDDLGISQEAQNADKELIREGVVAIIGHATTAQTLAGIAEANKAKVIMMGPTVSTPKLSGIDDYFFRIHPSFEKSSQNFAKYIFEIKGIKHIAVIFDKDNLAYSQTYSDIFSDKFKALGGEVTNLLDFSSVAQPDFSKFISELQKSKAEGVLIVASDMDTALIAQRARLMNWSNPMFSSPWAQTKTLIDKGGRAVEGMIIEQAYDLENDSENFVEFKSKYRARFGNDPSFGAAYSYESTMVLIEAIKKSYGTNVSLKDALLEIHDFKGLTDNLSFDKFGDVQRNSYLSSIKNGKFIRIAKLNTVESGGE
ncbi:ABC transporter substrate-binding protein [Clostridium saccharoperbutylacetonicum]|uniref:ABC transporter substrate-binding protein n=1 Tax=Clostridium saccharoperbutylacetonicum TaxID=36745 RepID=UPI000983EFE7|nr:ABC transporter substrate-binding protein [Clostridium saccharoperbutylacetonicum]AQR95460.1 leucine-, isoleucine-, valine-, threonine-, and alanine-binding protein precursor [Clostridium saccharoperbutylacetonicum]NSB31319.1 branched-chain amino acid transport system substrate-binding protein [Clostridium saccharoperbutylacetonicum]